MYIKKIELTNIRNIEKLELEFPHEKDEDLAGWHVLIGDNGSGKTNFLRAVSLATTGLFNWSGVSTDMLRAKVDNGLIELHLAHNPDYDDDSFGDEQDLKIKLRFTTISGGYRVDQEEPNHSIDASIGVIQSLMKRGWFSVAYGPFRGAIDGKNYDNINKNRRLAMHLSIFKNDLDIYSLLFEWLMQLRLDELEKNQRSANMLNGIINFINQDGILPHQIQLKRVLGRGVIFTDINDIEVEFNELSNGYRSIITLILDIIRQMSLCYETIELFNETFTQVYPPGVVLIDEVDAHLHPSWQREIPRQLTELFPNVQFIVTTHSPLVCQLPFVGEGDDKKVKGSIFRLPTPGTDEVGELLEEGSESWKRLVYGDILEAYSTDLFGENIERSDVAQKIMNELAKLSALEYERPLNESERLRMEELMAQLPNTPSKYLEVALERNKKL